MSPERQQAWMRRNYAKHQAAFWARKLAQEQASQATLAAMDAIPDPSTHTTSSLMSPLIAAGYSIAS